MSEPALPKETQLSLYRTMLLLRRFEEAVARAYHEGRMPGTMHLYIGQEAVAAGVSAHLSNEDYMTSTHRSHGHCLSKGVPPREVMAELFGRVTGCCAGRGGSMHLYSLQRGYLGSNGIVGAGIPYATGAAFSAKYRGTSQVAVCFFSDGANNTGSFHESLNLASILKLPVVYICENNLYATEVSFVSATAGGNVAARAASYAMPGIRVDGQDALAVYEVAGAAIARARAGDGPTLIECLTYRYGGHHAGDPGTTYRPREEIEAWKQRDPLRILGGRLLASGLASQEQLDQIDREVLSIVEDALQFAQNSAWPDPSQVTERVFAD